MNYIKLSQLMSYILRHDPMKYGLKVDKDGWIGLREFLEAVNTKNSFEAVTIDDLKKAMASSDKRRHEICGDRIRAVYGHSLEQKIDMNPTELPEILYHGTAKRFLNSILKNGLSPQARQYVHLSQDFQTAVMVGKRRDNAPVILTVDAGRAWRDGRIFYKVDNTIWLADSIAAKYLKI